jgi:hypothetical protein
LWQLEDAFNHEPQWSAFSMPKIDEEPEDQKPARRALVKKQDKQAKLLALTNGGDDDSDDSMPGLQSVSNSDEEDDDDDDDTDSDEYEYDDESDDDESGYDTEEEDEIRDLLREAMDAAHETNWLESEPNMPKEIDPLNEENIKGNHFLKLLGSLRGELSCFNRYTGLALNLFRTYVYCQSKVKDGNKDRAANNGCPCCVQGDTDGCAEGRSYQNASKTGAHTFRCYNFSNADEIS